MLGADRRRGHRGDAGRAGKQGRFFFTGRSTRGGAQWADEEVRAALGGGLAAQAIRLHSTLLVTRVLSAVSKWGIAKWGIAKWRDRYAANHGTQIRGWVTRRVTVHEAGGIRLLLRHLRNGV